jgi:hypothetical protein
MIFRRVASLTSSSVSRCAAISAIEDSPRELVILVEDLVGHAVSVLCFTALASSTVASGWSLAVDSSSPFGDNSVSADFPVTAAVADNMINDAVGIVRGNTTDPSASFTDDNTFTNIGISASW